MEKIYTKPTWLLMLMTMVSLVLSSCSREDEIKPLEDVSVTVAYDASQFNETVYARENVTLVNASNSLEYTAETDVNGNAQFTSVVPGVYSMTVSHVATAAERANLKVNPAGNDVMINGNLTNLRVYEGGAIQDTVKLKSGMISSLVIAKFYTNGVKDDNNKSYRYDYYYTIYNNGAEAVDVSNKYVGFGDYDSKNPFGPDLENNVYLETVIGLGDAPFQPGETRVFCVQAVDHTASASKSVDLSGADYEVRTVPSRIVDRNAPENNAVENMAVSFTTMSTLDYLNMSRYSKGKMNLVIFETDDLDALELVARNPTQSRKFYYKQVPTSGVLDGVTFLDYKLADDGNLDVEEMGKFKRLPDFIDTYTYFEQDAAYLGIAFVRKVKETVDGRAVLVDTNQSYEDFATTSVLDPRDFTVVTPVVQ